MLNTLSLTTTFCRAVLAASAASSAAASACG